jgi:hypothetical protein
MQKSLLVKATIINTNYFLDFLPVRANIKAAFPSLTVTARIIPDIIPKYADNPQRPEGTLSA